MTQAVSPKLSHWLRDEFQAKRLLPSLTVGLVMGVNETIFSLSVGSLVFSGALASYLAYGIGMALVTCIIILITISLLGSIRGVTGGLQDAPAAILAVVAASLASAIPATGGNLLPTVLVAIALATLLTGAFFLILGFFKLGGLVRFLPYPVIGGFLAGTGWLLVQGSFGVMADYPFTLGNVRALLQPDQLVLWAPGVIFAFVLFFGLRYIKHFLVAPGILLGFIALFYLALLATGVTIAEAMDRGLLLGGVTGGIAWQPLAIDNLLAADWMAILGQSGNIAVILIVSVVSLLLNASALELAFQQDIDLNRELRVVGLANLLSGLGGGTVGYHALDLSTLCCRTGAQRRLPGLVAGATCAVILFVGLPLLAFVPLPLLGGLLFFMGLGFLVEWVIEGRSKLPAADYAVVLLILVVIGFTDFLIGVGVGLVAIIILFVVRYSRVSVVRHAMSGAEMTSNVERCTYHRRVLRDLGQHVYVLKLQGFLFFGTANALLEQVRARVADVEQPQVRYIVMDFRRVTGLDSSAVISFVKGKQLAAAQRITLLLTSVSPSIQRQFELADLLKDDDDVMRIFPDLDRGLEWCEEQLLGTELVTKVIVPPELGAQLAQSGFKKANTARLMRFLERSQVQKGEYLIRQGDKADDLYFIEQGGVSVYLELDDGQQIRLQTLSLGTVVGELGLYLSTSRTASVIADYPTVAYRLTREALAEMREQEPELAAVFNEFVVRLLSERLASTNELVKAILR